MSRREQGRPEREQQRAGESRSEQERAVEGRREQERAGESRREQESAEREQERCLKSLFPILGSRRRPRREQERAGEMLKIIVSYFRVSETTAPLVLTSPLTCCQFEPQIPNCLCVCIFPRSACPSPNATRNLDGTLITWLAYRKRSVLH